MVTVLGTRPEVIRLSRVCARLDELCEHVVVHTGQNRGAELSDSFYRDLALRPPDHRLEVPAAPLGAQLGAILAGVEEVLRAVRPDRFLVLGDTNSALAAIVAARLAIPVFHLEAGNRCFDPHMAEEVNRRVVDAASDVLLPYTERSREHLLREGHHPARIHVVGNPIGEVCAHYLAGEIPSTALADLGLGPRGYFLATAHRQETVDDPARLRSLLAALARIAAEHATPVVAAVHPRTRDRIERAGLESAPAGVRFVPPQAFFDFAALLRGARAVLTDSGTVQEECCLLRVPSVILRDSTERPETLEAGATLLAGVEPEAVARATRLALSLPTTWRIPPEYEAPEVSATVARIVLAHRAEGADFRRS